MSAVVARRYFLRGRERLREGDLEAARRELSAALELHPGFVEARVGYAIALCPEDPPRAAQLLRRGLERARLASDRVPLLCALGDVLTSGGDLLGAEEAYAEAETLGPAPSLAARRARLWAKTGRYVEALRALQQGSSPSDRR